MHGEPSIVKTGGVTQKTEEENTSRKPETGGGGDQQGKGGGGGFTLKLTIQSILGLLVSGKKGAHRVESVIKKKKGPQRLRSCRTNGQTRAFQSVQVVPIPDTTKKARRALVKDGWATGE